MQTNELREKIIAKYKLEKGLRELKRVMDKLRLDCFLPKIVNGFREGEDCFKINYDFACEDLQALGHGGYVLFFDNEGDLCPSCEEFMKKLAQRRCMREKLGTLKRELSTYARRELKNENKRLPKKPHSRILERNVWKYFY